MIWGDEVHPPFHFIKKFSLSIYRNYNLILKVSLLKVYQVLAFIKKEIRTVKFIQFDYYKVLT